MFTGSYLLKKLNVDAKNKVEDKRLINEVLLNKYFLIIYSYLNDAKEDNSIVRLMLASKSFYQTISDYQISPLSHQQLFRIKNKRVIALKNQIINELADKSIRFRNDCQDTKLSRQLLEDTDEFANILLKLKQADSFAEVAYSGCVRGPLLSMGIGLIFTPAAACSATYLLACVDGCCVPMSGTFFGKIIGYAAGGGCAAICLASYALHCATETCHFNSFLNNTIKPCIMKYEAALNQLHKNEGDKKKSYITAPKSQY